LATAVLGWTSYFGLYLVASAIVVVNSFTLKLRLKILEVTFISICFLALFILTGGGFRIFAINPTILDAIGLFNIVTVISALLFLSVRNFMETDRLRQQLEEMSEMDLLTGTYNRRFFNKYLDIEIRRNASQIKYGLQGEVNFGIAMLDIDDFKLINDNYGHLVGDDVLTDIAHIIKAAVFERDILCRYGGEEFVILFTATSREGAIRAIEKIRKLVADHQFYPDKEAPGIYITISIGFASFNEESDVYRLLNLADQRLYQAKRAGKNCVVSN
jgi:diguanylate cyclase (GGDEF)-like protein